MPLKALRKMRLYWDTLRHIPLEQLGALARYRILHRYIPRAKGTPLSPPTPDPSPPNLVSELFRRRYRITGSLLEKAQNFAEGSGNFKGVELHSEDGSLPWFETSHGLLWQFELHYLDALVPLVASGSEEDEDRALSLFTDWMTHCPVDSVPGWDAYPLSKRLINACRCITMNPQSSLLRSHLMDHVATGFGELENKIEFHIGANHLLTNLHALVLSLQTLQVQPSPRYTQWVQRLENEWHIQFLSDGGHYERSPGYHAQLLAERMDILDWTTGLENDAFSDLALTKTHLSKQLQFLQHLKHPDGKPAHFHDTNDAFPPWEYGAAGESLDSPLLFPVSGFLTAKDEEHYFVGFTGCVGPREQPGHAHADGLSFETSFAGARVFVNAGVAGYREAPDRSWMRSAAAHNTIQIPDRPQHEVWSSFRVARRGQTFPLRIHSQSSNGWTVSGTFQFPGLPVRIHYRTWSWEPSKAEFSVTDRCTGGGEENVSATFLLHPDWIWEPNEQRFRNGDRILSWNSTNGRTEVERGVFMPYIGVRRPAWKIRSQLSPSEQTTIHFRFH